MNSLIEFSHFSWITCLVLLLFFLVMLSIEWFRKNKKNLVWRILALLLLTASLVAILWQPVILRSKSAREVILVGQETSQEQLDSLMTVYPDRLVIAYDTLYGELGEREVLLTGAGIPAYDRWKLENALVTYLPGRASSGLQSLHLPENIREGDSLIIKGRFEGSDSTWIRLFLHDVLLDSVLTDNKEFTLKSIAQVPGNVTYSLQTPLGSEQLGVFIKEKEPARIAIFTTYPTFEVREIKNFLASQGHAVLVRHQLSRNIFSYDFLNTPDPGKMSPGETLYEEVDLMIMDQAGLESLTRAEFDELERAVRGGLGILILPAEEKAGRGSFTFSLRPTTASPDSDILTHECNRQWKSRRFIKWKGGQ